MDGGTGHPCARGAAAETRSGFVWSVSHGESFQVKLLIFALGEVSKALPGVARHRAPALRTSTVASNNGLNMSQPQSFSER